MQIAEEIKRKKCDLHFKLKFTYSYLNMNRCIFHMKENIFNVAQCILGG